MEMERNVRDCEEKLNRLKTGQQDKLAPFHPNTRKVFDALQRNADKFRCAPKGPIGRDDILRLRDYKWTTAVEQVMGYPLLNAFVVDNERDRAVFSSIVNRVIPKGQFKPECIDLPFRFNRVHDISRKVSGRFI